MDLICRKESSRRLLIPVLVAFVAPGALPTALSRDRSLHRDLSQNLGPHHPRHAQGLPQDQLPPPDRALRQLGLGLERGPHPVCHCAAFIFSSIDAHAETETETETEEETKTSSAKSATATEDTPPALNGPGTEFIVPAGTLDIEDGETGGNIFQLNSAFVQIAVLVNSGKPEA